MKRTRKSLVLVMLISTLLVACAGQNATAPSNETSATAETYTTKDAPIFRDELTDQTISLRFYDATPSVAYVSMADFFTLMLPQGSMDVSKQGDGTYLLTSHTGANEATAMANGLGGTAVVDIQKGTLTSPNLLAFTNLMSAEKDGIDNVSYDDIPFLRLARVEYSQDPASTTLDFARYGIAIYADDTGVYLPFQTTSAIFSNVSQYYASYNGEKVYVNEDTEHEEMNKRDTDYSKSILNVDGRPEDLAKFSYAHLRFVFDYFEGYPARVSDTLGAHDLDASLDSLGDLGQAIKDGLVSTDLVEYLVAIDALSKVVEDGGHTMLSYANATNLVDGDFDEDLFERYRTLRSDESTTIGAYLASTKDSDEDDIADQRQELRDDAYGKKTYLKQGDTAVIVLDSFSGIDYDRWQAYYAGKGKMPSATSVIKSGASKGMTDVVGIFVDGLAQAAADPEVKNVIIDVSNNPGGSGEATAFITGLVTDRNYIRYQNTLTGQVITEYYDLDRNLDGSFDEKDAQTGYGDLNFAVLTSNSSFSCGNLFPSQLAEEGVLVIGERSGGGSCSVGKLPYADGATFNLSSWLARLIDKDGQDIDTGVPVDVDLMSEDGGYEAFYDLEGLAQLMDEHFGQEELAQAA